MPIQAELPGRIHIRTRKPLVRIGCWFRLRHPRHQDVVRILAFVIQSQLVAKKEEPLVLDLVRLFYRAPLWAAPIGSVAVFVTGTLVVPSVIGSSTVGRAFLPLTHTFTLWLCSAILIAGGLGAAGRWVRSFRDRRMLNRQTGIDSIRRLSWEDFERLVGEAYSRQGNVVRFTPSGADGGVDLVLSQDGRSTYVQCKRWRTRIVGVELIREFYGVMAAAGINAGSFVSSGRFTAEATAFAGLVGITLVDGPSLERMVATVQRSRSKPDALGGKQLGVCPRCGSTMVKRTAKRGAWAGTHFMGCPRFPVCQGTRAMA